MPYQSAKDVIQTWLDAVNGRKLDDVISLYAPECRLLPTFSPHTLRTVESLRAYFELLSSRPGMAVSLHDRTLQAQEVAPGVEIATGIYRFHIAIDDEPLVFEARFSFLVDLGRPDPILHHHSSQIPRTLS